MMNLGPPRGLIVDMITPLKSEGREIDSIGLKRLLQKIRPYADAILIGGPNGGEGLSLNEKTKIILIENTLTLVDGKIGVFIWCSLRETEKTINFILKINEIINKTSYSGLVFLVDSPLSHHSNRGLPSYYRQICEKTEIPIILHNDPKLIGTLSIPLKRKNIRTNILKEIAQISSIHGIIYCGTLTRVRNYQKALKGRKGFRIYDGEEAKFLQYPSLSGVVSIGANILPKLWSRITQSSINPESENQHYPDKLRQIWEYGNILKEVIKLYELTPVNLIKKLLAKRGIIGWDTCFESPKSQIDDRVKLLLNKVEQYMD